MQEQETFDDEDGRALLEEWRRDPEGFEARMRGRLDARMAEVTEQTNKKLRALAFKQRMMERQRVRQAGTAAPEEPEPG